MQQELEQKHRGAPLSTTLQGREGKMLVMVGKAFLVSLLGRYAFGFVPFDGYRAAW